VDQHDSGTPGTHGEDDRPFDLLCIGAGAKGVAVAAKTHALNSCTDAGLSIAVLDAVGPGAHWRGDSGYTSGHEILGTRPEKDVGFPYQSERSFPADHGALNDEMVRLGWARYLIDQCAYSGWVDAGVRDVTHRRFADYLRWVVERAVNGVTFLTERVTRVDRVDDCLWSVRSESRTAGVRSHLARAVMVTGPGVVRALDVEPAAERFVLDARTPRETLAALVRTGARICIVGAGESASSAALAMVGSSAASFHLEMIASGLVASRAESPMENRVYSDPESVGWVSRTEHERRQFIRRTDRGVISSNALARLVSDERVTFREGRVATVMDGDDCAVVRVQHGAETVDATFDWVVNCTGFDPAEGVRRLLGPATELTVDSMSSVPLARLADHAGVGHDLAVRGLTPRLFVPALAGFAQGPGFANLSSLGLMSDRVLAALLDASQDRVGPMLVETGSRHSEAMGGPDALLR
jgi:mycobactin lysine-N-oxygenase